MKASLNASVRDAQVRDSFNKESFVLTSTDFSFLCERLYKLQSDLPRNASKLHSLVVLDPKNGKSYLLNFEVLRAIPVMEEDEVNVICAFKDLMDSKKLNKKKGDTENDN